MKLKIEGTKENCKRLYLNDDQIGSIDLDHNKVNLWYSEEDFKRYFKNVDLNTMICLYYDEIEWINGACFNCTNEYIINYEEEEVE